MDNPWQVDSIQVFSCLKCPECVFDTKEENDFKNHALENHPLAFVLFGKNEVDSDALFDTGYCQFGCGFLKMVGPKK